MSEGCQIIVTDTFEGKGAHTAASRIHLHPNAMVLQAEETRVNLPGKVTISGSAPFHLGQAPYFPKFGVNLPRNVITLQERATLPVTLSYSIELR